MEQQHHQAPPESEPTTPPPRIYVASLSDYNAGRLHGTWIDATKELEVINGSIQRMLTASREEVAEEWAIHDYEGFSHVRIAEYADLAAVSRIAQGIETHGDAFAAWIAYTGDDTEETLAKFTDAYLGHFESLNAYAEQYAQDIGINEDVVAEQFGPYITLNVEQLAYDLEIDLAIVEATNGGIHVFDPHV